MPTYISLLRYTQQGIAAAKGGPARVDAARKAYKQAGAELKQFFLVTGQYDCVVIVEAPNDEVVAKLALALGAAGNVRSETFRAFTEDEYRKIVASLP